MIAWGGQPLGAALGSALAAGLGVPAALACAGAGVLFAGLLGLGTPLRSGRHCVREDTVLGKHCGRESRNVVTAFRPNPPGN
jgi:hypothetical protein